MARPKKPKPETEVKLENLQLAYLDNPDDQDIFNEYFLLLKSYARSICLKEIKSKIYLDPDRVEEVAVEATLKLLAQYKKPDWKVWGSFFGALRWKVVEALYEDAEEESAISMNLYVGDSTKELGDILAKIASRALWKAEGDNPQEIFFRSTDVSISEISKVLAESAVVLTTRQRILFSAYLLLKLRRPKRRQVFSTFASMFLTSKEEEAFELLMLEVRNRIAANDSQ